MRTGVSGCDSCMEQFGVESRRVNSTPLRLSGTQKRRIVAEMFRPGFEMYGLDRIKTLLIGTRRKLPAQAEVVAVGRIPAAHQEQGALRVVHDALLIGEPAGQGAVENRGGGHVAQGHPAAGMR